MGKEEQGVFKQLFSRYKIHYVFFWILLYIAMVLRALALSGPQNMAYAYTVVIISNITFLSVTSVFACFVFFFLLPRYGYNKKFLLFIIYSLISLLAVSVINAYIDHWVYVNYGVHPVKSDIIYLLPSEIFFTFLISASFGSIKIADDYLRTKWHNEKLQKEKLLAELEFLKAQIHPHFLFNTLNNLYFMIQKNPQKASELLLKLSDILRYQLYESNSEKITLKKELENINNYIELEKIRKENNLLLTMNVTGNTANGRISPYILLPFVENAFKHLSHYDDKKNVIEMFLAANEGNLNFIIKNSKDRNLNIKTSSNSNGHNGIGIVNLKRRLELLYPGRYNLDIKDSKEFYEVHLKLNLNEDNNENKSSNN